MGDEFLFSERFNNICIHGSSRNFLNRNKNSKLIFQLDRKKDKSLFPNECPGLFQLSRLF